ncbi:MAG: cytidine deaminase [Chakrabartia sp.]
MAVDRIVLLDAARSASRHAYAPYSGFAVGAALLLADGKIITGCNFENASSGLSLCAETVALATANSQGSLNLVREIAVVGGRIAADGPVGCDPVHPCGRCRQVIAEAAAISGCDILVHCGSADGSANVTHRLSTLLPYSFGPADLGRA